ncbi:MAG: 1-deoxy-D-xylulose-5-phosphate synthase, partial [Streptosporangiales bacterium]
MSLLASVTKPADLRSLTPGQLSQLAAEVRESLLDNVCATGGHLGPNLGVVELTLAMHRVFDSPYDPIVFDTGHQAYVHKLVTGRAGRFGTLRQRDGISGYPNRAESVHDVMGNSLASTGLAYADGLAKAFELAGESRRIAVAVVGDGALTGGLAWEALNNLAASRRRVVVVLNDNGRSYSPTAGAIGGHLARAREPRDYEQVVELLGASRTAHLPADGDNVRGGHGAAASTIFTDLGLTYFGPVDGHDLGAVESALRRARASLDAGSTPVVVHCVTRKGLGYAPAEDDDIDHMHSVGTIDRATGQPPASGSTSWTKVFADELCAAADRRSDVVGVTAAMLHPTGLAQMAARFPDRVYDVGIAEQYAVTSAAGLAIGGQHPVVAVYSTFLNRAIDQTLFDVGLQQLPVTFALDRSGITGPDGASHHGMWDLAMLRAVPGMRVAAPRDATRLREELTEALDVDDGPTAIRFPKASDTDDIPAESRLGPVDVLRAGDGCDVLLVAVGAMGRASLAAARQVAAYGVACTVVDPRWVLPVPAELVELAMQYKAVVTVEDGIREGGV